MAGAHSPVQYLATTLSHSITVGPVSLTGLRHSKASSPWPAGLCADRPRLVGTLQRLRLHRALGGRAEHRLSLEPGLVPPSVLLTALLSPSGEQTENSETHTTIQKTHLEQSWRIPENKPTIFFKKIFLIPHLRIFYYYY